jgi:hypothetical protein
MFYLDKSKEQDHFRQEFIYIEDYSLYYKLPDRKKKRTRRLGESLKLI